MNSESTERLEVVIDTLEKMASGDMSSCLHVSEKGDHIDALAYGINILAGEIVYKQEQEEKRRQDLEQAHLQLTKTLNDLKMTQEQLIQAAKLAVLGEVCASLAHEVSNPLATISGYMDLISSVAEKNKMISYDTLSPYIEKSHRQIERIVGIVRHVRDFSRKSSQNFEIIDLRTVIDASLSLFEGQFRDLRIDVEKDFINKDFQISGNFTLLEQVIINILANAKHAILNSNCEKRKIKIKLGARGPMAKIEVYDNGVGLDLSIPDIKCKVFDPFFTTKTAGQGTGIGLSISQGIVNTHGGTIHIDSAKEFSTVAVVELPLHSLSN